MPASRQAPCMLSLSALAGCTSRGAALYKAVCKRHPQCSIMLNLNWFRVPEEAQAQRELYEWLARALLTNEEQHYAESRRPVNTYKPQCRQPAAP